MVTVSAPGKLMLMGEHAVVYGYPCIVTAINRRLTVSMKLRDDGNVVIEAPESHDTRFVERSIVVGCAAWGIRHHGLSIKTKSALGAYGFGSSAAVTVATLQALVLLFEKTIQKEELFRVAKQAVLDVQGAGSGFDVAASIWGGTLYFVDKGKTIGELHARYRESNDQTISTMPLIVGYTGAKADTMSLVRDVAKKKAQYPEKVDRIFQAIAKLVDEARARIVDNDWERVGKLMDFNQEYLRDLGVSSEKLETLIRAAKKAGAYGAKLSGAGGGDCMIALGSREKRETIKKAIEEAGGEYVAIAAHAEGVRMETTDDQGELFIVVDKDDNILGYKTRYECHHDKTLIHRTVGVLLFDDAGRILLQKRSASKDMEPDLWGISAGGHVTKGQTDDEAAHRELMEELGVDVPLERITSFIVESQHETERSALYKGISNGPFHLHPQEVVHAVFFEPREIRLKVASKTLKLTQSTLQTMKIIGVLT